MGKKKIPAGEITLETVLRQCQEEYGLQVELENHKDYLNFLQEQQNTYHYNLSYQPKPKSFYLYLNLLVDKLYLFSCLIRQTKVCGRIREKTGRKEIQDYEHGTILDSWEKLFLMRAMGSTDTWDDQKLRQIYIRRNTNKKFYGLECSYVQIIDELGQQQKIKEIWGGTLNYQEHCSCKLLRDGR